MRMQLLDQASSPDPGAFTADFTKLVEAVGTDQFKSLLMSYLNRLCGADECAAFALSEDADLCAATKSAANEGSWVEATLLTPSQCSITNGAQKVAPLLHARLDSSRSDPHAWTSDAGEKLIMCARRNNLVYGLQVVRIKLNTEFDAPSIRSLSVVASLLISLIAKHVDIERERTSASLAFASLGDIESCVGHLAGLTRRETEVCARILYGLSAIGIALDLGVGEESVKTYRKRVYQRLSIGSERELAHWYLGLRGKWSSLRDAPGAVARRVAPHPLARATPCRQAIAGKISPVDAAQPQVA